MNVKSTKAKSMNFRSKLITDRAVLILK